MNLYHLKSKSTLFSQIMYCIKSSICVIGSLLIKFNYILLRSATESVIVHCSNSYGKPFLC